MKSRATMKRKMASYAYPSPPPTLQKQRGVFTQVRDPLYYEDFYGERNGEEMREGGADQCESSSDSDDDDGKRFTKSKDYQRPFGDYGRKKGMDPDNAGKKKYKIAPRLNPRSSVAVPAKKKLAAKKGGMFAGLLDGRAGGGADSDGEDLFVSSRKRQKQKEFSSIEISDGDEDDDVFRPIKKNKKKQPAPIEISSSEESSEVDEEDDQDSDDNMPPISFANDAASHPPVAASSPSAPALRAERPAHRQLISQQLKEHDKEKMVLKRKTRKIKVKLKRDTKRFKKGEAVVVVVNNDVDFGSFVKHPA